MNRLEGLNCEVQSLVNPIPQVPPFFASIWRLWVVARWEAYRQPGGDVNHILANTSLLQIPDYLPTAYLIHPIFLYLPTNLVARCQIRGQLPANIKTTKDSPSLFLQPSHLIYLLLTCGGLGGWSSYMGDIPPPWPRLKPHPHQTHLPPLPQTSVSPVFPVVCLSVCLAVSFCCVCVTEDSQLHQKTCNRNSGRGQICPLPLCCHHL